MPVNLIAMETTVPSPPSVLIAVPIVMVHQAPLRSLRIAITPTHWAIKATKAGRTPKIPKNEAAIPHHIQWPIPRQSASTAIS